MCLDTPLETTGLGYKYLETTRVDEDQSSGFIGTYWVRCEEKLLGSRRVRIEDYEI